MSKVPSESPAPRRRSGLPRPASGLPRLLSGFGRSHQTSDSSRYSTGSTWFNKDGQLKKFSQRASLPPYDLHDREPYNRNMSADIQSLQLGKDSFKTEEDCFRPEEEDSVEPGLSRREWPEARVCLPKCQSSFSHQLKMIVREDIYDDLPRPAWEEPVTDINSSCIGKKVFVAGKQGGYLRYVGPTKFAGGSWCGIELEEPLGRHDGSVEGVTYFRCRSGYGLFAPKEKVSLQENLSAEGAALKRQRLAEIDTMSSLNRRSDPTGSSSKNIYDDVNTNRLSDCTDDRICSNLLYEKYISENTLENPKYPTVYQNPINQRKPCGDLLLSSKHIRTRLSYLDAKAGSNSGGVSPDDVTYDDSSLGILTPNQMPDFTSTSIQPSPSDDIVDLPMDTCEGATAVDFDAWDFSEDASTVINELQKCDADIASSSGSSSPSQHQTTSPKIIHEADNHTHGYQQSQEPVDSYPTVSDRISGYTEATPDRVNYRLTSPCTKSVSFIDPRAAEVINRHVEPDSTGDVEDIHADDGRKPVHCKGILEVNKNKPMADRVYGAEMKASINSEYSGTKPKHRSTVHSPSANSESLTEESISSPACESNMQQVPSVARQIAPITTRLLLATRGGRHAAEAVRLSDHSCEDRPSDGSWHPSSMTLSSVSLDPGYQGDGEFDVPSEVGSGSAGTPTQDPQESNIHEEVADEAQMTVDTSSGVATEADISLGDDENEEEDPESESSFIANRTARVIDGKLYHSHRELMLRGQEGHMRGPDQHASEMDSSGFYSDLDPREDENPRFDVPPLQPLREAYHDADIQDCTVASSTDDFDGDNKRKSVSRSVQVNTLSDMQGDDEDKSNASTLRPESKELNGSERLETSPAPSEQTVRLSKSAEQCSSTSDLTQQDEAAAADADETARNYEKPWLSKPIVRKPEPPKKVMPPPPPRPKKNVESKLKAMLAAQEPPSEDRRPRQPAKKNKWDEVMSKIAEGKEQDKERPKVKEVKSRLLESLKAPQPMSPQAERIRQERRERRERREQALAAATARRNALRVERKRSSASVRGSNRTSRAPSLDSLPRDLSRPHSPDSSRDASLASHRSCSTVSNGGRGSEVPSAAAGSAGPPSVRGAASSTPQTGASRTRTAGGQGDKSGGSSVRSSRADAHKTAQPSTRRPAATTTRSAEPVKTTRVSKGVPGALSAADAAELKRLEAEVSAKSSEAEQAKREAEEARCEATHTGRGLEALTVLVHHLTHQYEAFSNPVLKAEIARLQACLQEAERALGESRVALEAAETRLSEERASAALQQNQLEEQHGVTLQRLQEEQQHQLQQIKDQHLKDLEDLAKKHQGDTVAEQELHRAEVVRLDAEHERKLSEVCRVHGEEQHALRRDLLELGDDQHPQISEVLASHAAREQELQARSTSLQKEHDKLKEQSKKLQDSLLSDTDHRVTALKNYCTGLQQEVDSLKSVVEMRNSELHKLRAQVSGMEQLQRDLDAARQCANTLQAKTEDLNAQMDAKAKAERQLLSSNRQLLENMNRESTLNKQLRLENEELQWKLRQREQLSTSLPMATLDLMTRVCHLNTSWEERPASLHHQQHPLRERQHSAALSKGTTRADGRLVTCSPQDERSKQQQKDQAPHDKLKAQRTGDGDSPPSSPCVKAVVEKSNSVSFILDLNDSLSDDSYLEFPASPRLKHGTPTFSRKAVQKSRSSSLDKKIGGQIGKNIALAKCTSAGNFFGKGPHSELEPIQDCKPESIKENGSFLSDNQMHERSRRLHSTSESSGGADSETLESSIERVSPSGLAWTVPMNGSSPSSPRSPCHSSSRDNFPGIGLRHLHQPEEDEYEENLEDSEDAFINGIHPDITPLVNLMNTSSSSPSDSELSRCGSQAGLTSESDEESSLAEGDRPAGSLSPEGVWLSQGAGEAMVPSELVVQCGGSNSSTDSTDISTKDTPTKDVQTKVALAQLASSASFYNGEGTPQGRLEEEQLVV